MKVTVLPVRDPQLPEPRPRAQPVSPPPAREGGFDGMPAVSVELLRVERKRHVPAARTPVSAKDGPSPAAAPAAVEIELPNGRVIRVPPGFSSADLERVLAIASADEPPAPAPAPPPKGKRSP